MVHRPDVYRYHDYRAFLKDWFAYKKASQSSFSLRSVAREAGLAAGYLPMVLRGQRALSEKALTKLNRPLGFSSSEGSYFRLLVILGETDSQDVRLDTLAQLQRFKGYRAANVREFDVHRYLTHWYYVVIREMALLPDFRADAAWIQGRLKVRVPLRDIEGALEFLSANHYLEIADDKSAKVPVKDLNCVGGVYRIALTQFHREMLALAIQSMENTRSEERLILGHSFSIPAENFSKAKAILQSALKSITELETSKEKEADTVYHLEMAVFPLTQKGRTSYEK